MSERDHLTALAAFAKEVIQDAWDGGVDGGGVQDLAERLGLIGSEPFDPAEHGENGDFEPGDPIFTFSDWLSRIQKEEGPETRNALGEEGVSKVLRVAGGVEDLASAGHGSLPIGGHVEEIKSIASASGGMMRAASGQVNDERNPSPPITETENGVTSAEDGLRTAGAKREEGVDQ